MRIDAREITVALNALGRANGRSGPRNVNLACRTMAIFASRDTKVVPREKIERELMQPARKARGYRSSRPGKAESRYEGTLAAAIVGARYRRQGIRQSPGRFYQSVARFVKGRMNSSGYHKAGHIPAFRRFNAKGVSRRRGLGRYKGPPPGRARAANASQKLRPHGFLENYARGVVKAQPNMYRKQVRPVARQLLAFARTDLINNAKKARLR